MKRNVLLVVRWPVGGIRTFIRYVYRNFDPAKWNFTILAPDFEETYVLVDDLRELAVGYVPVCGIPSDGSSGFSKMFRCAVSQLRRGNYDLVHSHGFTSGMSVAIPAFLRGTPHLMTSHDVFGEKQFSGVRGRIRKVCMEWLLMLIDSIHSVSNDAKENLLAYFPRLARKGEQCVVIPNGIEVERFLGAEPRDLREELGLDDDVFLIGFMGRFMAQKGFRHLVDAIEILREKEALLKRFLVLTFGDGGFIREEKQAIEERGLSGSFRFMPFTPNVAGAIKGLDVVVMPSLWEACGLLAMEVLACGVPLIGSDCIGLREVLQGTPAVMVPKTDASALAHAIKQEIGNSTRRTFLDFRETASERFDVRRTSQSILNLYERMIGQK